MYTHKKTQDKENIAYFIYKDDVLIWETKTMLKVLDGQTYEQIIESTTLSVDTLINGNPNNFTLNVNFYEDSVVMRKFIFGFIHEEIIINKTFVKYCKYSQIELKHFEHDILKTTFETLSA